MAPSNALPQTGGATQPAPSTQHTSDSATIMDDPVEMEQIKRHYGTIRSNFRLYFSEAGAQMHGPFFSRQINAWSSFINGWRKTRSIPVVNPTRKRTNG